MRDHEMLAEHYERLIDSGELEPHEVPGPTQMAADWEVSNSTATLARRLLREYGLATKLTLALPLGHISDMVMAFRFWPKVLPRNADGCLLWDAGTFKGEYGQFKLHGRNVMAHRVAFEYRHGPVAPDMELDHVFARGCRSKLCVNHEHLEVVTRAENAQRGWDAARYMTSIGVRTELDTD